MARVPAPGDSDRRVRFDDTLETVLAADLTTPYGVQSAWRQIVDLIGRRRAQPTTRAMATLRRLRADVPFAVRAASSRALEHADPPAPLVRLFAVDDLPVALPVLRSARLSSSEWVELLPDLAPAARQLVRNRRDLSPVVKRALESFGPIDFVLADASPKPAIDEGVEPLAETVEEGRPSEEEAQPVHEPMTEFSAEPLADDLDPVAEDLPTVYWRALPKFGEPDPDGTGEVSATPSDEEDFSFVALAGIAAVLPDLLHPEPDQSEVAAIADQSGTVEADAASQAIAPEPAPPHSVSMDQPEDIVAPEAAEAPPQRSDLDGLYIDGTPPEPAPARGAIIGEEDGPFEIAEVVARIDAFWRHREEAGPIPAAIAVQAEHFRFETDSKGVMRWVEGVSRTPLVGLSLDLQGMPDGSRVDGVAAGAFRSRAGFSNARLWIEGESDAAGDWLISAIPVFDPANGRFTGYRGTARRPRVDERAEPARSKPATPPADSLRQLVHELRTPTNAIAGFAEMIETQMLGPVADPYRERAHEIRNQARELLGAIDDLDLAARIDSAALGLVPGRVALRPLLAVIADDLAELTTLRGSMISLPIDDLAVEGDRRAIERLLSRLMATLVSASGAGERIGVHLAHEGDAMIALSIERPQALADYPGDAVLGLDDEREDATLLGVGFALRLARNLARELGGGLSIDAQTLTLRLPAAVTAAVGQAHLS